MKRTQIFRLLLLALLLHGLPVSAQDDNAAGSNSQALAERAQVKACAVYCNSSWDLVDAMKAPEFTMASIKAEQLPEIMQHMTEAETS